MNETEPWARVKAIFRDALDLEAEKRDAFLVVQCQGDAALLSEVRSLLEAHVHDTRLLEDSARELLAESAPTHSELPLEIGPFKAVERIGMGGMGVVYRAERSIDGGTQTVALKLIATGLGDSSVIRRFMRERSILARLQHPHIAHFVDAGTTADGRPWMAMQFIEGQDLLRHCNGNRLTIRERVTLFLQAVEAIGFAHRNLVIHRDIKPSNILVDSKGQVRLLDFGIAKLLDDVADLNLTGTAVAPMTPEYAAPEQILGENISTATDIHALGIVLFELLCGRLPYVIESRHHIAVAVCEREPQRLRQALVRKSDAMPHRKIDTSEIAKQRSTSVGELVQTFDRDLDHILAKALARLPEERYANAEAMGDDLRAWLGSLPLRSQSAGWRLRLHKFVRRHRIGVAVTAALLGVAGAGIVATLWQAELARQQANHANAARRVLGDLFKAADPRAMDGRELTARELIDQSAARLRDDPRIEGELRASLLSDLGSVYQSLGEAKQARALFHEIAQIRPISDETLQRAVLAEAESAIDESDFVGAVELAKQLDQMIKMLPARSPIRIESDLLCARIDYKQGRISEALAQLQALIARIPDQDSFASQRGDVHFQLAEVETERQQFDAALSHLRRVQVEYRKSGESKASFASVDHEIARNLSAMGRYNDALPILQGVYAEHARVFGADHPLTLSTQGEIANLLRTMNRFEEASKLFLGVIDAERRTLGPDHDALAVSIFNYGILFYLRDEFAAALPHFEEAVRIWTIHHGPEGDRTLTAREAAAAVRAELGQFDSAIPELKAVVTAREAQGDLDSLGDTLNSYGVALDRAGAIEDSLVQFRRAIDISAQLSPNQPDQSRWTRALLGRALRRAGQLDAALAELRQARASFLALKIGPGPRVAFIDMEIARTLRKQGQSSEEIRTLYQEALGLRRAKLNPEHPKIKETEHELAAFERSEPLPDKL